MAEQNTSTKVDRALDIYDRDLRGVTSPFRREIIPSNVTGYKREGLNLKYNTLSNSNNIYKISDYRWYTGDIYRRFNDDYYNKIYVDEAKAASSNSKGLLGQAVSFVGDLASDAIKTGIDSVNQIRNSVDNLLNSKKKEEQEKEKRIIEAELSEKRFNKFLGSFPFAKVYEFKPQDTLGSNVSSIMAGMKMIDDIVNSSGSTTRAISEKLIDFFDFLVEDLGFDAVDPHKRIYTFPNRMYKNLISGYFTGYYEIPLLENTDFLESRGQQGWNSQSFVSRMFGDDVSSIAKNFMSNYIGSGLDIATRPKWNIEGGGDGRDNISATIILFNDDLRAVTQNLSFIHSFVGGNMWYQDNVIQKCSSLYDIEFPGRFRYYFCCCDVKVSYKGKIRKFKFNETENATSSIGFVSDNNISKSILGSLMDIDKINMEVFNNIPDAYEITFDFKSLIPNNYNTYISYILANRENEVQVGDRVDNLFKKFTDFAQAKKDKRDRDTITRIDEALTQDRNMNLG